MTRALGRAAVARRITFIIATATALGGAVATAAAQDNPVTWSAKAVTRGLAPGGSFDVAITGVAEQEWHVYSVTQGPGGPVPTTVRVAASAAFERNGAVRGPVPATAFDPNFEIKTETYDGTFALMLPMRLAVMAPGTAAPLRVDVEFQACTRRLCLPPQTVSLVVPIRWQAGGRGSDSGSRRSEAGGRGPDVGARGTEVGGRGSDSGGRASQSTGRGSEVPQSSASRPAFPLEPVTPYAAPLAFGAAAESWSAFLWLAVSMGALSLLTPCVFPMVPITVSYFTSHAESTRRRAAGSAALYGLGIVLTFTVFGGVLAAFAGAAGLNRFAANPWVNLGITALFIMFALNLFGLYELRLPSRVMTRLDGMSRRRGTSAIGTLLMALTFTVTSLTCTAAFIGTLLVVAARGEWQRPIAGLLAYSATFALPFVALAMAPQLVSQLPRSGPWLARVKVVMGFLEIAAAMKFLSNADLVWSWHVFTRTVVLAAWILTAVALATYLLRDKPRAGRIVAGMAALAFAVWLGTGLRGHRLGELEAFLPPFDDAPGSRFDSARGRPADMPGAVGELGWITNDLDAALAQARSSKQRVIIDFTGYTCTNCRWMEANMFPRPDVRAALGTFVRARLYTDGQGPVYERQQRLQQERFKTVALPLYAIIDADERAVATFAGLTRDQDEFLRFLRAR